MTNQKANMNKVSNESKKNPFPDYEPPKIVTYTSDEILEEIGPAQACASDPCPAGD